MHLITTILLSLLSIVGVIYSLTGRGVFQKVISIGLCVSVLMIWSSDKDVLSISMFLQLGLGIATVIYALIVKVLNASERITVGITGLIMTLGTLADIQHYPGQGIFRLALLIPIILFLWSLLKNGRQQPKEFGFMLIWVGIAAVQLINYMIS